MKKRIVSLIMAFLLLGSTVAWAADDAVSPEEKLLQEVWKIVNDPSFNPYEENAPVEIKITAEKESLIYDPANYEDGDYEVGSVLVGLKTDVTRTEGYEELFPELDIVSVSRVGPEMYDNERLLNQIIKIRLEEQTLDSVITAIEILRNSEYVLYAEPDYYLEEACSMNCVCDTIYSYANTCSSRNCSNCFNNAYWNLSRIELIDAWELAENGETVTVGVIDSGISSYQYGFGDNYDPTDYSLHWSANDETGVLATTDLSSIKHGTIVAGIIGGDGTLVPGVCPNIDLRSLQANLENGSDMSSNAAGAISIASARNIPIVNISLNIRKYNATLSANLQAYAGLAVIAAGNDNMDLANLTDNNGYYVVNQYVTECNNLIIVGSSNWYDEKAAHSNYNQDLVDLFAPGVCIYSFNYNNIYDIEGYCGTSVAAPQVAGVAALIKSIHPNYTSAQIKHVILSSVDEIDDLSMYCKTGGRLNAKNACEMVLGDVNLDGEVTNADLILIARYLVELVQFNNEQKARGDYNGDGEVDNADLILIANLIVNN